MPIRIIREDGPIINYTSIDKSLTYEVVGRPDFKVFQDNTTSLIYEIAIRQNELKVLGCAIIRQVINEDGSKINDIPKAVLDIAQSVSIIIKQEAKDKFDIDLKISLPDIKSIECQVQVVLSNLN